MTERWIDPELTRYLKSIFPLKWDGFHGGSHWARVRYNAKVLANKYEQDGEKVDRDVLNLFAVLHDHARTSEGLDPLHGLRAAEELYWLRGKFFEIPDSAFDELWRACAYHSDGYTYDESLNVKICWDADRLDLLRVGKIPNPLFLCTEKAQESEIISAAMQRSIRTYRF